jgi:hypothetical protein
MNNLSMDNEKIIAELQDIVAKIPGERYPTENELDNALSNYVALRRVKISLNELIARIGSKKVAKFHQRSRHKNV